MGRRLRGFSLPVPLYFFEFILLFTCGLLLGAIGVSRKVIIALVIGAFSLAVTIEPIVGYPKVPFSFLVTGNLLTVTFLLLGWLYGRIDGILAFQVNFPYLRKTFISKYLLFSK